MEPYADIWHDSDILFYHVHSMQVTCILGAWEIKGLREGVGIPL